MPWWQTRVGVTGALVWQLPLAPQHPCYRVGLITAFTALNLFIGIIVNTIQGMHYEEEARQRQVIEDRAHDEREEILRLMREM